MSIKPNFIDIYYKNIDPIKLNSVRATRLLGAFLLAFVCRLAAKQSDREEKRQAILQALSELGYEVAEGMETALVKAGKVLLQKGGEPELDLMGQSLTHLLVHAIFSTKDRRPFLRSEEIRD
jgi:hypothetical protein